MAAPLLYAQSVPGVPSMRRSSTNLIQSPREVFSWSSGEPAYGCSQKSMLVRMVSRWRSVNTRLLSSTFAIVE